MGHLPGTVPREMSRIHAVAHRILCTDWQCGAAPGQWCGDEQGHHLARYYRAQYGGLITDAEMDRVLSAAGPVPRSGFLVLIAG